jgi:hypothetical protein
LCAEVWILLCGLTALGYKICEKYAGSFGTAFKLKGLDSSNSNAFCRFVVLHAYGCIPDTEPYPLPICNSLGCAMVSCQFLKTLSKPKQQAKQLIIM